MKLYFGQISKNHHFFFYTSFLYHEGGSFTGIWPVPEGKDPVFFIDVLPKMSRMSSMAEFICDAEVGPRVKSIKIF